MTKRASGKFERRKQDSYATPYEAVVPLLPHLLEPTEFDEPCCGNGDLAGHLERWGHQCSARSDIETGTDALTLKDCGGDMFITNPPWPHPGKGGEPTLSIALHLSSIAPTWLLLSSDFAHNVYFAKLADRCVKIVSIGRVSWMGNNVKGFDNAAWYLFDEYHVGVTEFVGRTATPSKAPE